jgi:hypothetical protein
MKFISICFIILTSNLVDAQIPETNPNFHSADNWIFGDSVWLKFQGDLTVSLIGKVSTYEVTSSLSDSHGNIEIFGMPNKIFNSSGINIANIKGGNSSTQGCLIDVFSDSSYIIFTNDEGNSSLDMKLRYHTISFNENVLLKNKILLDSVSEGLNIVSHRNNRSRWLLTHKINSDKNYFFLIKSSTIICPTVQRFGGDYSQGHFQQQFNGGTMKFSPNGSLLVSFASESVPNGFERIDIQKFNTENAKLSQNVQLKLDVPFSASFSPNSKVLYVSNNRLFQYNLINYSKTAIEASRRQITPDWNNSLGSIHLTPNNEIYLAYLDSSHLGLVANPNDTGIKCNFSELGVELQFGKSLRGLPNFNASYFYTPSIDFAYTEDCWGHSYAFEGRDTFDADGYKWIFSKMNSTELSVISSKNCVFTFPDTGKWEVSHIAWNTARADTVTKTLTIRPKWQNDVLGRDTFYCTGDSIKLTLQAPQDMHCVHWNEEEPNLDEALGPIVDYDHFHTDSLLVDTAGTYIVKVTNKTFCQMWDTIRVTEKPNPQQPNIQRISQELESTIAAAEYRWYYEGRPKFQNEISKIQPDSNGYWQVQLVSEFGCESELSDSLLVGFASVPSIKATNALSFKVYPNPSDGNISIKVPKQGEYNIQITDLNGKVVYTTKHNLNLSFEFEFVFAKGTYIVTLTDEEGNTGSKQIVVR